MASIVLKLFERIGFSLPCQPCGGRAVARRRLAHASAPRPAARAAHASHRRLEARLWPEESAILANYFLLTASSDGAAPQQRRSSAAAAPQQRRTPPARRERPRDAGHARGRIPRAPPIR
ncbi:hypothetical protein [Burkholderia mallei]|uniref:hypothetical protein n=1 Tax=Burkholderia mallei TaxID=13373 RepID=UPI0018C32587|nr:hypothetical protein [Burkholderia mallei]